MKLIDKIVFLSSSSNDGTFVFTDISGGKLQVGTGEAIYGTGFVLSTSFVGIANIPSSFGGKSITVISQYSLGNTQGLTGVVIPSSIEEINDASLTVSINIEFINFSLRGSLKSIGNYAF